MTSKEYWQNLKFESLVTYSLLRGNERGSWSELDTKGSKELLLQTGLPHPTAKMTGRFLSTDEKVIALGNILSTEFTEQYDWMCSPVFREAVVFYDKEEKVVSILNVCLSCDRLEPEHDVDISTDHSVFQKLREFFKSLGHQIEG